MPAEETYCCSDSIESGREARESQSVMLRMPGLAVRLGENLSPAASFASYIFIPESLFLKGMKNKNTTEKGNIAGALQECDVNRLIVEPLVHEIKQHGVECQKQVKETADRLQEVSESIDIIARQLYRQSEGVE